LIETFEATPRMLACVWNGLRCWYKT